MIKLQLNKMVCEKCGNELLETPLKSMQIKCPKCSHITSFGDYRKEDKSDKEKR